MNGDEITEYIQTSGINFDDESTRTKVREYGFTLQSADTMTDEDILILRSCSHKPATHLQAALVRLQCQSRTVGFHS